ncbi:hypothetical protein F2Q69_00016093 [Brassica cretica]|uniref:Replication protein A 70 kDa DNA-binding subunit B/D first OB fold domain-containing protein n=1 Tax=Brassica cretica TaxID=69181 RepID=A0A8S9R785_BRACR|nr:hypothetical protein F2Q69_00016093 [Brassica cretica]
MNWSADPANTFYKYVLADEEGTKMEMTIYGNSDRFRGQEKQEGKWVEIFRVGVNRSYPGFQATNSRFNLSAMRNTQVHIIDPLTNRLFMDFKNIHAIPHMDHRDRNYPIYTMGVVFNTEAHFDDPASPRMVFYIRDNIDSRIKCMATGTHAYAFRDGFENMKGYFGPPDLWLETESGLSDFRFNPRLLEVEAFRQSLLCSDPYVQRYGAVEIELLLLAPFYKYVLADEEGTKMEMTIYGNSDRFRGLEKQEGKWVEIFRVEVNRSYPGFQVTNSRFNLSATRNTQVHIIDHLNNRLFMDFKNIHAIPHMDHRERNYLIDTMRVVFNTEAHFDDPASPRMVFYIRDSIDSRIKCAATGAHAYAFQEGLENMKGRGQVIVVLKMWRVWKFLSYFGPPDIWLETEGGLSDIRFNPRLPEVKEFRQSLLRSDPYVQRYGAVEVGLSVLRRFLDPKSSSKQKPEEGKASKLAKRVIACLDVRTNDKGDLVVTKGDQYDVREQSNENEVRNLGKPVDLARQYYKDGADEISFLNITGFRDFPLGDLPMIQVLRYTSENVFVPLTVGGGIRDFTDATGRYYSSLEVAAEYFRSGADKISIGSDAVYAAEEFIKSGAKTGKSSLEQISRVYGNQAVVVSIDPRRVYVNDPDDVPYKVIRVTNPGPNGEEYAWYQCTVSGGREGRPIGAYELAKAVEELGAGEILLNCIDCDGQGKGFDTDLVKLISDSVGIPVIASSGAGTPEHFSEVFETTNASAALAAGIFHRKEVPIQSVKEHLLEKSIEVRM